MLSEHLSDKNIQMFRISSETSTKQILLSICFDGLFCLCRKDVEQLRFGIPELTSHHRTHPHTFVLPLKRASLQRLSPSLSGDTREEKCKDKNSAGTTHLIAQASACL